MYEREVERDYIYDIISDECVTSNFFRSKFRKDAILEELRRWEKEACVDIENASDEISKKSADTHLFRLTRLINVLSLSLLHTHTISLSQISLPPSSLSLPYTSSYLRFLSLSFPQSDIRIEDLEAELTKRYPNEKEGREKEREREGRERKS